MSKHCYCTFLALLVLTLEIPGQVSTPIITPVPTQAAPLQWVDLVGGKNDAVLRIGDFVYLGQDTVLSVFQIRSDGTLERTNLLDLSRYQVMQISSISRHGNLALVSLKGLSNGGVAILSIEDVSSPSVLETVNFDAPVILTEVLDDGRALVALEVNPDYGNAYSYYSTANLTRVESWQNFLTEERAKLGEIEVAERILFASSDGEQIYLAADSVVYSMRLPLEGPPLVVSRQPFLAVMDMNLLQKSLLVGGGISGLLGVNVSEGELGSRQPLLSSEFGSHTLSARSPDVIIGESLFLPTGPFSSEQQSRISLYAMDEYGYFDLANTINIPFQPDVLQMYENTGFVANREGGKSTFEVDDEELVLLTADNLQLKNTVDLCLYEDRLYVLDIFSRVSAFGMDNDGNIQFERMVYDFSTDKSHVPGHDPSEFRNTWLSRSLSISADGQAAVLADGGVAIFPVTRTAGDDDIGLYPFVSEAQPGLSNYLQASGGFELVWWGETLVWPQFGNGQIPCGIAVVQLVDGELEYSQVLLEEAKTITAIATDQDELFIAANLYSESEYVPSIAAVSSVDSLLNGEMVWSPVEDSVRHIEPTENGPITLEIRDNQTCRIGVLEQVGNRLYTETSGLARDIAFDGNRFYVASTTAIDVFDIDTNGLLVSHGGISISVPAFAIETWRGKVIAGLTGTGLAVLRDEELNPGWSTQPLSESPSEPEPIQALPWPLLATYLNTNDNTEIETFRANGRLAYGNGQLYFTDPVEKRVLRVNGVGDVELVATADLSGVTAPLPNEHTIQVPLESPHGVLILDQTLLVADSEANCVFSLDLANDSYARFAGTGSSGSTGDGGQANQATLNGPSGLAMLSDGSVLITEALGNRIRIIDSNGVIRTLAGNGSIGNPKLPAEQGGDGAVAGSAFVNAPLDITVSPNDDVYVTDPIFSAVRKIAQTTGGVWEITTALGGRFGYENSNEPLGAALAYPEGLAADSLGNIYVCDSGNHRILRIASNGSTFIAGGIGVAEASNDGSVARLAGVHTPLDVITSDGKVLFLEMGTGNIRSLQNPVLPTPTPETGIRGWSKW